MGYQQQIKITKPNFSEIYKWQRSACWVWSTTKAGERHLWKIWSLYYQVGKTQEVLDKVPFSLDWAVFVFLDLAWSHVLSISYSLLSNGQCSFQPFKCHRRMEGNHNIWCFHLNMNWFPSQGESASKAETDFPNWLRPRGGDWWTALESHQKVSQDLFKT